MEEAHNFEILSRKTQRGDQEASEPTSTNWFGSLNDREKFYAITLSMFNGLRYSDFYRIYELVLEVMQVDKRKEEGNEESPVFDFGFSDDGLVDRINAQVKPTEDGTDEFIEFKDDKYAVEVFDIMRRRRSILLKFLPILKQIVERNRQWDIRVRAALAVAEIGKTNFYEVHSQILESWAGDARAYVRATVGYSLAHLARKDKNTREKVESILDSWTIPYWRGSHETWRYPWTVASVYKQIGSIEANWSRPWAYRGLETIAGYADKRLVGAVIHSLIILSLQGQLQDILIILKKWIEEGSKENIKKDTSFQTRSKAGVGAFFILSEIHSQDPSENTNETANDEIQLDSILGLLQQGQKQKSLIWQLTVTAGVKAFEFNLYDNFFDLINSWVEYTTENPAYQQMICELLVDVHHQVRPLRQSHICNRLSKWERQKKDKNLAEIATLAKARIGC